SELDRKLMRGRRYDSARDLRRTWKCICRDSASPQFVTECRHVLVGIVSGDQRDGLLPSFRRRFPENWQLTDNGSRCFKRSRVDILRQKHLEMTDRNNIGVVF